MNTVRTLNFISSSTAHRPLRSSPPHRIAKCSTFNPNNHFPAAAPPRSEVRATLTQPAPPNNDTQTLGTSVPSSVRDADVVIVGGSAVGSLAASMFHQRGLSVTLIEKQPDFLQSNMNRSFALGLFQRGVDALKNVPGLYEYLSPFSSESKQIRRITTDSKTSLTALPNQFTIRFFMRYRLLHAFKTFVSENTNTRALYGHTVSQVHFQDDGFIELTVTDSDNQFVEKLRSRLVLACDGRFSTVAEALRRNEGSGNVHSSNGFKILERDSPAVGMKIRSMVISQEAAFDKFGLNDKSSFDGLITILEGRRDKNLTFKEWLKNKMIMSVFPMVPTDIEYLGGIFVVMVLVSDNNLWKVDDLEEAYRLFEDAFPQVDDIRSCISEEQMSKFIAQRPGKFPPISRPASLAASIGRGDLSTAERGAVVVLGEAAHCFPPDSGQGVNAGLEDVVTFMRVLNDLPEQASVHDVAVGYEEYRDGDLNALMTIAQTSSPYQYGQSRIGVAKQMGNYLLKNALSRLAPTVFHPSIQRQLVSTTPYQEILEKDKASTLRIYVSAILLVGALCIFISKL